MKFRIFPLGILLIAIYDLLSLLTFGLAVLIPSPKELWMWIVLIIMLIALPFLSSWCMILYSLDLIVIDDNGIEKYHFGKLKKRISWDDIVTASIYSNNWFQGWIYISDQNIKYNSLTSLFMMYDKKSICFKYSDVVIRELNEHLNNKIILSN